MQYRTLVELKKIIRSEIKNANDWHLSADLEESKSLDGEEVLDVLVNVYVNGDYIDGYITDYYEPNEIKAAEKRFKAVERTIEKWLSEGI